MSNLVKQIMELSNVCSAEERELIEDMVYSAADYVRQVVVMESAAMNLAGLDSENYRTKKSETDEMRSLLHDGLITDVDIVNRMCEAHGLPRIYTGERHRRCYGDFAIALVDEIFNNRS